jgi:TRAP-type C4-dicarboxylate transport system permease small subunit
VPLPFLFSERPVNFLERIPKIAVTALITLAIVNLLIGVFLRYVVGGFTNYMDWDPVPFTWVEEVGEMALAWLTLVGAAIGIRSRSHFTLYVFTPRMAPAVQRAIDIFNHLLIAGLGLLAAFYGVNLCRINWTLKTPGLEISMAALYASAVVGGLLIAVYAISVILAPPPRDPNALH